MCGIVGFAGHEAAASSLVHGLRKLEYRGYDSAGISVLDGKTIQTVKSAGKIANLDNRLTGRSELDKMCVGIGHTRWATHGEPSDKNAHPHGDETLTLVHNGIIENYLELREELKARGIAFLSETDTEVAARVISGCYHGDPLEALREALPRLRGAYAFAMIFADYPERIYAVRKGSPLVIMLGEGENFIASDITAYLDKTKRYILLREDDIAVVTAEKATILAPDGVALTPKIQTAEWDAEAVVKGGYDHFMLKEIFEQPKVVKSTVDYLLKNGLPELGTAMMSPRKIHIVACGTAFHAGMLGKTWLESFARIPTSVHIASEFRYSNPILRAGELFIAVSQSGETADTLEALKLAKSSGLKTLAIVNVVGSSIAREADKVLYTHAGPEISVASTKAYSVQLAAFYLLSVQMGVGTGNLSEAKASVLLSDVAAVSEVAKSLLLSDLPHLCEEAARDLAKSENIYYIGRGQDYALSLEGSLKLKEISYIHSEACAAGELKHGTISLIENGTLVVAICTNPELAEKTASNIKEVKSRGARVLLFCYDEMENADTIGDICVKIPTLPTQLMPMAMVIPLQLFAYYMAVARGCDVDQPRNLAKSVTVE